MADCFSVVVGLTYCFAIAVGFFWCLEFVEPIDLAKNSESRSKRLQLEWYPPMEVSSLRSSISSQLLRFSSRKANTCSFD